MKKFLVGALVVLGLVGCSSKAPVAEVVKDTSLSPKSVYFDFDKSNIKDDQFGAVAEDTLYIKEKSNSVVLEGNADSWGSDEYNYALGLKRAKSVKDELVNGGVDESLISIVSNGESKPVCTESTKECWSKNRRVDVLE